MDHAVRRMLHILAPNEVSRHVVRTVAYNCFSLELCCEMDDDTEVAGGDSKFHHRNAGDSSNAVIADAKQGSCSNDESEPDRMPLQGEGDNHGKTDMRESLKSDSFKLLHRLDSEESFYDQEFDTEIESKNSNEKTSEAENSRRRFTSNDDPKPNLIVNYLPQTLSDKDFFNLFIPYGKLESIKIMRDSQTGYSFGYGFVNYFDLKDAIEARNEMNGTQLGHKRIKVSFARPPSDDIKDTNLFVTGLSPEITETELEEMFSPHGVIVHLRVLRDRETKETRGVAFVRYETRSEACAAILELNGMVPPGAKDRIRVRLAQDHGKQKAAYLAGYQAALKFRGNGRGSETVLNSVPYLPPLVEPPLYQMGRPRNMMTSRNRPTSAVFNEGQTPKAGTSTSDQTLYWKGFLQGTRGNEPRRSDSLHGRIAERRSMAGSSRSRY